MLSADVDGVEASDRSFDFSKFPNFQEVRFEVGWERGGLRWVPAALSTLTLATSPRMSTIRLNFVPHSSSTRSIEALLRDAGGDFRWVADELARIGREFEGAVDVTVSWGRCSRRRSIHST